jgi:hypothetical protein
MSPTAIIGAHASNTTKNQNTEWKQIFYSQLPDAQKKNASDLTDEYNQLNETILLKIKELTEQGIGLEFIQIEIQNMLKKTKTEIQNRGQNCTSLRGSYEISIFSCRGLA